MAAVRKEFRLCETLAGVLHNVSEAYAMDGCWLPWKFERHVLTGGATPFRITTKDYPSAIKDGVDQVSFEVHYHNDNPNLVKFIRFNELPGRGKYIVTQTSMKHIEDGSTCPIWIEIPKGADRDGIAGAHSLLKAKICCSDWKDHLPPNPETELEQAHLTMAQDDVGWLKKQIISKNNTVDNLLSLIEISKTEIDKLKIEIAKTDNLTKSIVDLKAEVKAECKAKDKAVDELKSKLGGLNSSFAKIQATLKKIEKDLKGKGNVEEESASNSSTPIANKRRRIAPLKTPKNKSEGDLRMPNTAPAMHGSYLTLHSASGTDVASRTPLPNGPRFQTAQFSLSDTTIRGRTRAETMASVQSSDYTPTANHTRSGSTITVSSLSSLDSDAVGQDIFD